MTGAGVLVCPHCGATWTAPPVRTCPECGRRDDDDLPDELVLDLQLEVARLSQRVAVLELVCAAILDADPAMLARIALQIEPGVPIDPTTWRPYR